MFLAHLKSVSSGNSATLDAPTVSRLDVALRDVETIPAPTATTVTRVSKRVVHVHVGDKPAEIIRVQPVVVSPVETFDEYPNVEQLDSLKPLRGSGRSGDFVHQTQTMDAKFRNVSRGWTERANDPSDSRVMTWDMAMQHVEKEQGQTRDVCSSFDKLRVEYDETSVFLLDDNGNRMNFTETSIDQLSSWTLSGLTLPRRLSVGDENDKKTLCEVFRNGLRHLGAKENLLRLRTDGTLRAVLSGQYTILDNRWFLEVMRSIIPSGLISHFRSPDNCDSIFGNILIPDSMRAESDSDYGGMLAFGNGETGERKLSTCPSVFRAICMNGCIWDEVKGTGIIKKVHRGAIDLQALASLIRENLNRQIPLLGSGIDAMLLTREHSAVIDAIPAIGAVLRSLNIPGLTKNAADGILNGFKNQRTEFSRVTAFDVIQGITKAAQAFSPGLQETAESAAGSAMLWTGDRWQNVFTSAKTINADELSRVFGVSA